MTIYFDITTTLSWGGAQVGITRVEREIARRAARYSRHSVRHCIYHAQSGRYYTLKRKFADAVLERGWWIDQAAVRELSLGQERSPEASPIGEVSLDDPARAILELRRLTAPMSLSRILALRANSPLVRVQTADQAKLMDISQIVDSVVPLRPATWIVNGGLDWENKDIRHLRRLKQRTGFHYAAILYDIIPLLFPQYVVPFYVDLLKRYFGELFWTADLGLCISGATRKDVQDHLQRWRMPVLPLVDWPLGSDIPETGNAGALPGALRGRPFLLYVSTIEPRKSHRTITEAFDRGVREGQIPPEAKCVFVGRVGWNSENLLQEIRANPLLADRVVVLSDVPDSDLIALYQAARFVVFPSRYEGYGLSLVEAMAMGKACLSGDAGSLREVGGDAPLYIDPIDIPAWCRAIALAFTDDAMIDSLAAQSRSQYSPISWDESAKRFFDLLDTHIEAHQ